MSQTHNASETDDESERAPVGPLRPTREQRIESLTSALEHHPEIEAYNADPEHGLIRVQVVADAAASVRWRSWRPGEMYLGTLGDGLGFRVEWESQRIAQLVDVVETLEHESEG